MILGQFHSKDNLLTCYAVVDFIDHEKAEQICEAKKEWGSK